MKPRDNTKVFSVRFFEGANFQLAEILHDTLLPTAPRIGEGISLRYPREPDEARFQVTDVEYLIDVQEEGISPVEELTGVRVLVRRKY